MTDQSEARVNSFYSELNAAYRTVKNEYIEDFLNECEQRFSHNPEDFCCLVLVYGEEAWFYRSLTRYEDSVIACRKGLRLLKRVNQTNTQGYVSLLNNMAETCRLMKLNELALRYYRQALSISFDLSDLYGCSVLYRNISKIYADLNDEPLAVSHLSKALTLLESIPGSENESVPILCNLMMLYHKMNRDGQAAACLGKAQRIIQRIGVEALPCRTEVLNNFAGFLWETGDYENAVEMYERVLECLRLSGDQAACEADVWQKICKIQLESGNKKMAAASLKKASGLYAPEAYSVHEPA